MLGWRIKATTNMGWHAAGRPQKCFSVLRKNFRGGPRDRTPVNTGFNPPTQHQKTAGQMLVELLVAIGLAAIMLPALATALVGAREGQAQENERLQATALLREASEAIRSVREKGWTNIATNGTYHPTITGNTWSLAAGSETIDNFIRHIVISDVQRNSSGAIIDSGGTVDPSTKKITITLSWTTPITTTMSEELYFSRHQANAVIDDTTQADFNTGAHTNTTATNTSGGEIQLASTPGSVSWTTPSIAGSLDLAGIEDVTDVFVSGNYAYVADSTILRIINISNPATPTLTGSYTAAGAINGISVSGNYAYLATSADTAELTVVNITNPATPVTAASFNIGDAANATNVYIDGTYAYVGKVNSTTTGSNEFNIVNITTPTAPSLSGSLNLSNTVNAIHISGNYAYLATSITTAELTIVNITSKTAPAQAGIYNTTGTAIANDVFAVGTTVYIAKANDASGAEFFIINAATPATPTLVGSHEVGANINGVAVSGTTAFLATALTNAQFRVLNMTTPATPTVISSFNMAAVSNKIALSGNYAFLASAHDTREFAIMQGTVSAGGYQTSGTYTSSTFDLGNSVGFNYLNFTSTEPASTNIQFQIATNNDNATWNYNGPDGTASTFYTSPSALALIASNTRYLRYRATLTGPGTATPVLQDITVNYSP